MSCRSPVDAAMLLVDGHGCALKVIALYRCTEGFVIDVPLYFEGMRGADPIDLYPVGSRFPELAEVAEHHQFSGSLPGSAPLQPAFKDDISLFILYPEDFGRFVHQYEFLHGGRIVSHLVQTDVLRRFQGEMIPGALNKKCKKHC